MNTDASWLSLYYQACGVKFGIALPFFGLLSFVLTCMVLFKVQGRPRGATLACVLALPVFVGLYGMIDGWVVMAEMTLYSTIHPKPSEYALGSFISLYTMLVGLFLSLPSYILATIMLSVRALRGT